MSDEMWESEAFDRLAALTAEDFHALTGASLPVGDPPHGTVRVVGVTSGSAPSGRRAPFTVDLVWESDAPVVEGMHAVRLPVGMVPLFLSPGLPTPDGQTQAFATFG